MKIMPNHQSDDAGLGKLGGGSDGANASGMSPGIARTGRTAAPRKVMDATLAHSRSSPATLLPTVQVLILYAGADKVVFLPALVHCICQLRFELELSHFGRVTFVHSERHYRMGVLVALLAAVASFPVDPTPPVYQGPLCASLQNICASVELNGLFLEVADSVIAPGGRGLFIRCAENVEGVTVGGATPLCGYADGGMELSPDSDGGKTVAFALKSPGTAVYFEKELHTVGSLLESGLSIAGHAAELDASGVLTSVTLDPSYDGPRYFVPRAFEELSVMNIGQFANDLAIGGAEQPDAEYYDISQTANLIVLVQRLERDEEQPNLLLPSRPVSTLARDVTFENSQPMELGCEYGPTYWQRAAEAETGKVD